MDAIEELIYKSGLIRILILSMFFSFINLILGEFRRGVEAKKLQEAEDMAMTYRAEAECLEDNRWYDLADLDDNQLRNLKSRIEGIQSFREYAKADVDPHEV